MADRARGLPSGVLTFLLIEIAGAPLRWDDEPRAMSTAVVEHFRHVREHVAEHHGVVSEEDPAGATTSVFASASDALRAARAVLIASIDYRWSTTEALQLRAAVHTAEACPIDGIYRGAEVNRAARLRAVAKPSEVLVSASTCAVVRMSLPSGMVLHDMGSARLRGLTGEEHVSALHAPGLPNPPVGDGDLLDQAGVTPRERDVFHAVADRLSNAEIATRFIVSERTIESHVSSLLRKLQVEGRLDLAELARSHLRSATDVYLPSIVTTTAAKSSCVGRAREQAQLRDLWGEVEEGQSAVALITGEAGIGKSRLAADLALQAHARGARVLFGAAVDGAGEPMHPFADALRDEIDRAPEHLLREDLGPGQRELARVLPEVASRLGVEAPDWHPGDATGVRVALVSYLRRLAQRQPLVVLIEDVQWASPATRDVIIDIARRAPGVPLLMIATARDVPPDRDEQLTAWLAEMGRLPATRHVSLSGLSEEATAALLVELHSDAEASVAQSRTRGNPLFLHEFAISGTTGETTQDFAASRLTLLSPGDRSLVELGAVLGESISAVQVARVADRSVLDVLDSLDAGVHAGLLHRLEGGSLHFSFTHALVRDAVYGSLPSGRQLQLHHQIVVALDRPDAEDRQRIDLTRHAAIAAPIGDARRAIELCRAAGERALVVGDLPTAAVHFERALDIADLVPLDDAEHLDLATRLGASLVQHEPRRSSELLRDTAERARRLGLYEAMARAVCAMTSWGGSVTPGEIEPTFVRLAEQALHLLGPEPTTVRVQLQALLGAHLALADDPERGRTLCDDAVEAARALEDPAIFIHAVLSKRYSIQDRDRPAMLELLLEAEAAADASGLVALQEIAAIAAAGIAIWQGDLDHGRLLWERAWSLTEAHTANTHVLNACLAMLAGDLDEARRRNQVAYAVLPPEFHFLYPGLTDVLIDFLSGHMSFPPMDDLAQLDSLVGVGVRAFSALQAIVDRDPDSAAELLAAERQRGLTNITRFPFHSGPLSMWAEVAAFLEDADAARELLELLEPFAGGIASTGPSPWASVDHARGLLLTTVGDHKRAISLLNNAVATSRARRTPILLGRELVALARARQRASEPQHAIEELIAEANDVRATTGAAIIRADIENRLSTG